MDGAFGKLFPLEILDAYDQSFVGSFSQCNDCAHRLGKNARCDAFPEGIPIEVRANGVSHDRPLPEFGQGNGIVREVGTRDDNPRQAP